MTSDNLIELRGLGRRFAGPQGAVAVLDGIDLTVPRGTFTVIRGQSGAGKTTLLRILGLLDAGHDGTFRMAGTDVAALSDAERDEWRMAGIGFVFQDGRLLPHLSLGENIGLPLVFARMERTEAAARRAEAVAFAFRPEEIAAGVCDLSPASASGGQRQRAALARAMIRQPELILADEPTASLDEASKQQVLARMQALHQAGATVVVVSHDDIFFDIGRQFMLQDGRLHDLGGDAERHPSQTPPPKPEPAKLGGWWPRLGARRLVLGAWRDLMRRPLFALLTLIALVAGTAQVSIFTSLVAGLDAFTQQTIADGSRLTRLTLKPRKADMTKDDRFPLQAELAQAPDVSAATARRATTLTILGEAGTTEAKGRPFPTLGLHPDDPELTLFRFVAGQGFATDAIGLQMIATTDFLVDIFGLPDAGEGTDWQGFVGKRLAAQVPRFGRSGKQVGAEPLVLTITGVILNGEGDRQFYLPNQLLVALDAIKRDRTGKLALPLTPDHAAWMPGADLSALTDWPWQDMLHIYLRDIDRVVPRIAELSRQGFRPEAEIWKYLWVLDLKSAAFGIVAPLLALVSGVVALVLFTNIVISARLREGELALSRVLGMRRGDVLATEVIGILTLTGAGMLAGFALADRLTSALMAHLTESARVAADLSGEAANQRIELLFQPIWTHAPIIALATLLVVLAAVLWPTLRIARTDPARVFARS
jgi:ABC-type lipoprotein export system ATPase subunit